MLNSTNYFRNCTTWMIQGPASGPCSCGGKVVMLVSAFYLLLFNFFLSLQSITTIQLSQPIWDESNMHSTCKWLHGSTCFGRYLTLILIPFDSYHGSIWGGDLGFDYRLIHKNRNSVMYQNAKSVLRIFWSFWTEHFSGAFRMYRV